MATYMGGKNVCFHQIINQIPPHQTYIETHLGSGAVMRALKPAHLNIGIDLNEAVLRRTAADVIPAGTVDKADPDRLAKMVLTAVSDNAPPHYMFVAMDALTFLQTYSYRDTEFIYCDPPYVMSSRSTQRNYYEFEYTDADHIRLLTTLKRLSCPIAISGYFSELYADMLNGWRVVTFNAMTRGGPATEFLWMNYPEPAQLHDYRYLGDDRTERQRIKRKKSRWLNKLKGMDRLEQQAILWAISEAGLLS